MKSRAELPGSEATPDYRFLFEACPGRVAVILGDAPRFTVVNASDAYLRSIGKTRDQVIGLGFFEILAETPLFPPSVAEDLRASFHRVLEGGEADRVWRAVNSLVPQPDGSPKLILQQTEDVPERYGDQVGDATPQSSESHAEAAMRRSEDLLQLFGENMTDVFWLTDFPQTRMLYVSPSVMALTGRGAEVFEFDLAEWNRLIHADDASRVHEQFHQQMAAGGFHCEHRLTRPDGTERWVNHRAFPVRDAQGNICRVAGVVQDITARKLAEDELRRQWSAFDTALSNTPDFTYTFDLEGRFTYVNRALLSLWQLPLEDARGKNFFELGYPADLAARLQDQIQQVIRTKEILKDQTPFTGPTGETRYYEYIFVPILTAAGNVEAVAGSTRDITEAKVAEAALRESEARFSNAFSEAPIGMVLLEPSGRITEVNAAYLAMLGYSREELETQDSSGFTHPDDVPLTRDFFASFRGNTPMGAIEKRYIHKDGRLVWARASASVRRDDSGAPTQVIAIVEDVTERKRVEAALQEQLTLTAAITDNASLSLFITDPQQKCIFMNPAAERLTGFSHQELQGRTLHDVIHYRRPDGSPYPRAECPIDRVFSGGEQVHGEEVFIHKDGHLYPVAFTASSIGEGSGITGSVIEMQDITERRQMENALREGRARLEETFAQAPVAVVVFRGRDFVVELANPLYRKILGGRELVGRPFREVVPELGQYVWDALTSVLDTGEPFVANDFHVPFDADLDGVPEDHWFNVVYNPFRRQDGEVSGIVAVLTEVTAQVLARKELERVNRDLEEFAYVSSHDLHEPLRMVNIYTHLIVKAAGAENEQLRQYGDFVREGVERMETLLKDLLTFSRTVQPDEVAAGAADLSVSLRDAIAVLKSRIEENMAVLHIQPLPVVRGDTLQLTHVLQNVLSNALKYRKADVRPEISVSAKQEGAKWIISVQDNGIGFDPRYAERVFGLFKRLHGREFPGTGLGLAICKRIIERYGGTIWAESELGIGTIIRFALPCPEIPA